MKSSVQYKKIKKGNIVKLIQTINLRDDISCGIAECEACEQNKNKIKENLSLQNNILILDTEMILSQIDAIKNFNEIENVILFQSEYLSLSDK